MFRRRFTIEYPDITAVLSQFGLNPQKPLEIMDIGFVGKDSCREYITYFCVKGRLGVPKIKIGQQQLTLRDSSIAKKGYTNTTMEEPYFIIEISNVLIKDVRGKFYEALQQGREIELTYKGKGYFESRNSNQDCYVYCEEDGVTQHFESQEELMNETILGGTPIKKCWNEITI